MKFKLPFRFPFWLHAFLSVFLPIVGFLAGAFVPAALMNHKGLSKLTEIFLIVMFFVAPFVGPCLMYLLMKMIPISCPKCGHPALMESVGKNYYYRCESCDYFGFPKLRDYKRKGKPRTIMDKTIAFTSIVWRPPLILIGLGLPILGLFGLGGPFLILFCAFIFLVIGPPARLVSKREGSASWPNYISSSLGIIFMVAAISAPMRGLLLLIFFGEGILETSLDRAIPAILYTPIADWPIGVCGVIFGLIFFMREALWRFRQASLVRKLPTTKTFDARLGLTEFEGTARDISGGIAGKPLITYEWALLKGGRFIETDETRARFLIEDDTGTIPVELPLRDVEVVHPLLNMLSSFSGRRPMEVALSGHVERGLWPNRKYILKDGDPVYVIGNVEDRGDIGEKDPFVVRPLMESDEKAVLSFIHPFGLARDVNLEEIFYLSDSTERGARGRIMRGFLRSALWAIIWTALSLWLIVAPQLHRNYVIRLSEEIFYQASPAAVRQQSDEDLKVTFRLAKSVINAGETPEVVFSESLFPREGEKYWINVVESGAPDNTNGDWQYLNAGATGATLQGVMRSGNYEVRLFARYPTSDYLVIHREFLDVVSEGQSEIGIAEDQPGDDLLATFEIAKNPVTTTERPLVVFNKPLEPREGEKYWITYADPGAEDTSYKAWKYLGEGTKQVELEPILWTGEYEVRLHARYPTEMFRVICRRKITVIPPGPEQEQ